MQSLLPFGSQQEIDLQKAYSCQTPDNELVKMLSDSDGWIRGAAIANSNTPHSALLPLHHDEHPHVQRSLAMRQQHIFPYFSKPQRVLGFQLRFRDAKVSDASFILSLRTDEQKSRHLSQTSSDIAAQEKWLETYAQNDNQVYFIIESMQGESLGTVRLYDQQGSSFCWGSWIIKGGAPASVAIESALMVYRFGRALGFAAAHFDVRKGNTSVWRFHERFGAQKTSESPLDFYYHIDSTAIHASLQKYAKHLPHGIVIQ